MQGVEVKDWSDTDYTGKAVEVVAGAQGLEASEATWAVGLPVVTGECPIVGITGGYTQSPLSTAFGFSADNKLEFVGLTAEGKFVAVNPSLHEHVDLFWALSCSDSGNYGVVVSVTLKAHPDAIISAASFTIAEPYLDYSAVVNAWYAALPDIVDSGIMATYYAEKDLIDVFPITGYNRTQVYLEDALAPLY